MSASFKTRRVSCAVAALAFAILGACAGGAEAKSKPKKSVLATKPFVSIAPPERAPFAQSESAPAPARYFTINQVLAKYDGNFRPAPSVRLAAFHPAATVTDASVAPPAQPAAPNEPFGMVAFRAPDGLLWVKWRKVESEIRADMQVLEDCRADAQQCASAAAVRFQAMVDEAREQPGRAKIETINRSINAAIRYMSNSAQHGVPDLWSSPLATLASGRGDCEDYAIAKYMVLREAGVAIDDLQLVLVRDRAAGQDHAVLAVRHDGRWLILDNRHLAMNEAAGLPHFMPLFAINHQGVKLFAAPYASRPSPEREAAPAASHGLLISDAGAGTSGWNVAPLLL